MVAPRKMKIHGNLDHPEITGLTGQRGVNRRKSQPGWNFVDLVSPGLSRSTNKKIRLKDEKAFELADRFIEEQLNLAF